MRVDCTQCGKVINIPPEKLPNRAFSFACPNCQHRLKVEPPNLDGAAEPAADAGDETRPVLGQSAEAPSPQPATAASTSDTAAQGAPPLPLKTHERQLLASQSPVAFIVELGATTGPDLDEDLQSLGMAEIRRFQDLEEAVEQLLETEIGMLIIAVPKAAAPPFEPLEPLAKIPSRMRRRVFVALLAGNVTSLDGQVAFFLQVNCLINSGEVERRRSHLQRALLYHLKLYQHWTLDPS